MLSAGTVMLATTLAGAVPSTLMPDDADLFRTTPGRPDVEIIIDRSGSMNDDGYKASTCSYYVAQNPTKVKYNKPNCPGGQPCLDKFNQVKAIMAGCNSSTDGVIERWAPQVSFQVREYQASSSSSGATAVVIASWGSSVATMKSNILAMSTGGYTPMVYAIWKASKEMQAAFTSANSKLCRKKFQIFTTDGVPNNVGTTFAYECGGTSTSISATRPDLAAKYNYEHQIFCNLPPAKPPLPMYTIGIGQNGSDYNETLLRSMATLGGGQFFPGGNEAELNAAFESILSSIATRSAVFFSVPGQSQAGLFTGNRVYLASFKPTGRGRWTGNLKAHCVLPPILANGKYDTTVTTCMFKSTTGADLLTNPGAVDAWNPTLTPTTATEIGGASLVRKRNLGTTPSAPYYGTDSACAGPCKKPKIFSWRQGTAAYVPVNPTTWKMADTWTSGAASTALINYLHGYQRKQLDTTTHVGAPIGDNDGNGSYETLLVDSFTLGDPMHAPTLVVQYAPEDQCTSAAGKCYVFIAANDGMLHVFDTFDGTETSALVPADLWFPNEAVHHQLKDIDQQPTLTNTHKYFVDGALTLVHNDANGNVYIDGGASEKARLIFSLGRGGRAMYMIDLKTFDGVFDSTDNPIYPISYDFGSSPWSDLQNVLFSPWAGEILWDGPDGDAAPEPHTVLAFGSGHIPDFDFPELSLPRDAPGPNIVKASQPIDASGPPAKSCMSSIGATAGGAIHCSTTHSASFANPTGAYDTGSGSASKTLGPLKVPGAVAMRYCFDILKLERGSSTWPASGTAPEILQLIDGKGYLADSIAGGPTGLRADPKVWWAQGPVTAPDGKQCTGWVYDDTVTFKLIINFNGVTGTNASQIVVNRLEYMFRTQASATVAQNPTVYLLDIDNFNASTLGTLKPFTNAPGDAGVVKRFMKTCPPSTPNCVDESVDSALAHMVCPIIAPITTYGSNRFAASLYWFDQCGQIFVAKQTNASTNEWDVRRLLSANHAPGTSATNLATPWDPATPVLAKHLRKGFTRLSVTAATCSGAPTVGVYFGTGNGQRLRSVEELVGSTVNSQTDVAGVVFDNGSLEDLTVDGHLQDITTISSSSFSSAGKHGWFFQLGATEKVSRDPLVFLGTAYYKTHSVTGLIDSTNPASPTYIAATSDAPIECTAPMGVDSIYAVKACNGRAVVDGGDGTYDTADRKVYSVGGEGGGGLVIFAPKKGEPFVSAVDNTREQSAPLVPTKVFNNLPIQMWREPRIKM
ncbi:MAG: hypothetical protein HYV07_22410 [Deltaproteobacteria bacterium]|nr:hypothetical protein [Deltaproteobacteria bacterium]